MYIGIAEQQKVGEQGRDNSTKQFSIQPPLQTFFSILIIRNEIFVLLYNIACPCYPYI